MNKSLLVEVKTCLLKVYAHYKQLIYLKGITFYYSNELTAA